MLADVVIMRIGLIFLLIGTHSFAPYCGSWDALPNSSGIELYGYISPFTHYISMPALIFISGYLFGHSWQKTKRQPFKLFVVKKFKRLIIPSVIFSLFYFFLFNDTTLAFSEISLNILNGSGHLWFLPMLFWCFVFTYILHKANLSFKIVVPMLVLFAILPVPTLPFRLSSVCSYLIFFYVGSILQMGGKSLKCNGLILLLLMLLYFVLQVLLPEVHLSVTVSFIDKLLYLITINCMKLLLGIIGVGIAFIATRMFLNTGKKLPENIITLSTFCYGVYIFHQFILKEVYYESSIALTIHPDFMPWIAYATTLVLSVAITALFLKTNIGRYLIG